MLKRTFIVALLTLLLSSTASALTLEDVIYLSSAGVDDSIIIAKIDASGVVFDLSTREIVALWEAGVSAGVIEYMIATAEGAWGDREYREEDYEDYEDYDDDVGYVRHPTTRVHLYFGFGYYDGWYYPWWWWHRPYYHGFYSYSYGYYWPYYYYWSPYAYYYPWDCWSYRRGCHIVSGLGMRHHWRRHRDGGDKYYGRSGYRLKPRYSYTGGKRGGYLARDGRYVFPKDRKGREYVGTHRGYRKPLAYGGRGEYWDHRSYRTKDGRSRYSKPRSGRVTGSRTAKDKRYHNRRYKSSRARTGHPKRVGRSKSPGGSGSKRGSVHSSRSRGGGSRSHVRGSRSSGSRGSARGSSGSSRGSRRGGRSR